MDTFSFQTGQQTDTVPGVKISRVTQHGKPKWQLDYYAGPKRIRLFFKTKGEALAEWDKIGGADAGEAWALLNREDRNDDIAVCLQIRAEGLTAREVRDAHKQAGKPILGTVTLRAAIAALLDSRRAGKRREAYLTSLRQALAGFAKGREEAKVAEVTSGDIEAWLPKVAGSRSTYINRLNTLFSFCLKREWIGKNPVAALDKPTLEYVAPKILTALEATKLLKLVRQKYTDLAPWIILGMLAGLRPEEADRVTWVDLNWDAGTVTLSAALTKVRHRRIVHLMPSALAWLKVAHELCPEIPTARVTRRRAMRKLRDDMGWKVWPKDILRHTAASYLLAHHQDVGKVAKELGNSPGVLLKHYQELVTKEQAEAFWSIKP